MKRLVSIDLYDHSHEETPAARFYVGVIFALLFEAIAGVSGLVGYAAYQFLKAWIGVR